MDIVAKVGETVAVYGRVTVVRTTEECTKWTCNYCAKFVWNYTSVNDAQEAALDHATEHGWAPTKSAAKQ